MKFIKKHKIGVIISVVILTIVLGLFFGIRAILFSNNSNDVYGNRLDGRDDVPIESTVIDKIKEEIMDTSKVETITYRLQGKIINFNVDVKADVDLDSAKSITDKILSNLSDEVKNFYDIQVYLTCKGATGDTLFPVIGYKHKTKLIFSWSNTKVIEDET